jgi:hypothetical protein
MMATRFHWLYSHVFGVELHDAITAETDRRVNLSGHEDGLR